MNVANNPHRWLVVSLDVSDLGEWVFQTRKQALSLRSELIKAGAESDNISLYYGKIILSRLSA